MKIGIDGSRAFISQRTGIEEYSYQVIKSLRDKLDDCEVFLYVRKGQKVDFSLPKNWKLKIIRWPRFWTQIGLSFEIFFHPIDSLFVPAHTVPFIHPSKTAVVIHGLEYEIMPEAYSSWGRLYMRFSIRNSCRWAEKVISVSRNTKQDLVSLYGVPEDKIQVIYEGYDAEAKSQKPSVPANKSRTSSEDQNPKFKKYRPYLLFIGRLEERKNIIGIIETFEILKEKYEIPHNLLLAGKGGYNYESIAEKINGSRSKKDIRELGFVADEDKFDLMKNADVFMFPTFYEGFGIPILEAQSVGVPVVTSNVSSMPEVADESAILVDPREPSYMAERTYAIISDEKLRTDMIKKGYENIKRFSWDNCAKDISKIIKNGD
jgi:glycosyltransferase involved in cell wall biosynthesis